MADFVTIITEFKRGVGIDHSNKMEQNRNSLSAMAPAKVGINSYRFR